MRSGICAAAPLTRAGALLAALLLAGALGPACSGGERAYAGQVQSRSELVGGPRAIGEVGDYRLSNGRVRFIVQNIGASRVYETFGGSLIDADLERPAELDPRGRPLGKDGLGELFPLYFLSAIEPKKIEVLDDGASGGTARVRITGRQSEFLTSTKFIDDLTIGGRGLTYLLDYALAPGDDFLTITSSIVNGQFDPHIFPSGAYPIPLGFVGLFGDGQPLFLPGEAGYDVRFSLEKSYKRTYALPAFPGITTDVVAVEGDGVSYGLSYCPDCPSPVPNAVPPQPGFAWHHRDQYAPYDPGLSRGSMLVPFISGTLLGLFLGEAPPALAGGKALSTTMRLRVSDGSPAHHVDSVRQDQGGDTALVTGVVREERSEDPVPFADVVLVRRGEPAFYETSARADAQGRFTATVRPGAYRAIARLPPHPDSAPVELVAAAGAAAFVEPHVGRTAFLAVEVSDETGRRVPAKVTLDAPTTADALAQPQPALYDFHLGDPYRPTNLDPADPRYLETTLRALDGRAEAQVRPGKYRVTVSRGPAYALDQHEVELLPGQLTRVGARLSRVLPANGRVAADLHVHAQGSVDSDVRLEDRAASFAAEGVDFLAMTEHNFVEDLQPVIDGMGLTDFLRATPGIELTSLEAGHWNAYPLAFDAGSATHGSFPWFRRLPQALFDDLRARGKYGPEDTVVQVNHPRDAIQGYFNSYGVSGDELTGDLVRDAPGKAGTFAPNGPGFGPGTFSLDFDAIEILTGKRFDLMHTFHVPDPNPERCDVPAPRAVCKLPPGAVVRDSTGAVAFPGAVEDWEHLLDLGRRVTAVGNSDSHKLLDGEGGYPRNLVDLGHDFSGAGQLDDREVARAIKAGRVSVTTAPQVTLTVVTPAGEVPVGSVVQPDSAGTVLVHLVVEAAPWVDVTRAQLLVPGPAGCFRGDACSRVAVPVDPALAGQVRRVDARVRVRVPDGRDSWVAAEVVGDRSLWPVVIPYEIPTLLLTDAVGTLGSALGLADEFGALKPRQKTQMFPYALTNAVYVDGNRDGKWGTPLPRHEPRADGSGDSAQLIDLRRAVERAQ